MPAPQLLEQVDQGDQAPEPVGGSQTRPSTREAWSTDIIVRYKKSMKILGTIKTEC